MTIKDHKSLQGSKILLVEDDKSIRLTVSETLNSEGFKVSSFKDGLSALDFITNDFKNDVDLIILDLMLPGLNGLELCRKIRNEENYTPILILSAKDNESDRVLGLEVGADDYLTKPFGLNELIAPGGFIIASLGGPWAPGGVYYCNPGGPLGPRPLGPRTLRPIGSLGPLGPGP